MMRAADSNSTGSRGFVGDFDHDRFALSSLLAASGESNHDDRTRREFLALHTETLYDELTDHRRRALGLHELVAGASVLVPELVPGPAEIDAEQQRPQPEKLGTDLHLGALLGYILRSGAAGNHLVQSMLRPTARATEALPEFRTSGWLDLDVVTVRRSGATAHVTMRNEKYLNAEDDAVVAALETAIDLALLDEQVAVGVLRGAHMTHPTYAGRRVFNSGINLTHLYQGKISFLDFFMRRELGYINKLYRGLFVQSDDGRSWSQVAEKPWIGAVESFAIGGGAQLLLALDHVIAEESAYFTLPALQEGIIPGAANLRLARFTDSRLARQLIFDNRKVSAGSAEGRLLCDRVVGNGQVDDAIADEAERLGNRAVVANRRMLRFAEEPLDLFRQYMAEYALEQSSLVTSPDLITNLTQNWISRQRGNAQRAAFDGTSRSV